VSDNYEWCGSSTYQASGWETIVNDFEDLGVAAYMSEYGYVLSFSRDLHTDGASLVAVLRTRRDCGKR
jgi:hypothetical protein